MLRHDEAIAAVTAVLDDAFHQIDSLTERVRRAEGDYLMMRSDLGAATIAEHDANVESDLCHRIADSVAEGSVVLVGGRQLRVRDWLLGYADQITAAAVQPANAPRS